MILFAGDSFSANDEQNTWPNIFAKNLNKNFKNISLGGSSFWYTFKKLRENNIDILQNNYEYIIITCTSSARIPYCVEPDKSYYLGDFAPITQDTYEISNALLHNGYYRRFYDPILNNYLYEKCLADIIFQLRIHTKIILLGCFPDSLQIIRKIYEIQPNFCYLDFSLRQICAKDINNKEYKNHFSEQTNIIFGELLANRIKSIDQGLINLTVKEIKRQ